MILGCSAGHQFDTDNAWFRQLKIGGRCPMELSYNRMDGSEYCRRKLKLVGKRDEKDD